VHPPRAAPAPWTSSSGDPGFSPPYRISHRGLKLPRVPAALGRCYLRSGTDLPQVARLLPPVIRPGWTARAGTGRASRANRKPKSHCRAGPPSPRGWARPDDAEGFAADDRTPTAAAAPSVIRRATIRASRRIGFWAGTYYRPNSLIEAFGQFNMRFPYQRV
jgi:hypothetical protein